MTSPAEVVQQLNNARDIVLRDAAIYPQVVPGVLPVIGASAHVELRRWGSDFLAETFASPVVTAEIKEKMCVGILDTLRSYLNRKEDLGEDEDPSVVKSAVQCAASVYSLVFRHTISNAADSGTWGKMAGIKSSILRRMDSGPAGVRVCCIKFVARVVQVQTPGLIADPRRPDQNEISLALVPRDHSLIPPSNLEAEASGLLDRLLGVLQDNVSDALIVTATLNSLSSIVQRRPSIANKILATVLAFNPLQLASTPMSGKDKIAVRSMTRTTMAFLINFLKRNQNHAFAGRIQAQNERLRHTLFEVFSGNDRKRPAPDEPTDGLDDVKRLRIEKNTANGTTASQQQPPEYPPLPSGPVSYAQLFTLSRDPSVAGLHVQTIPYDLVAQLVPPLLASIEQKKFDEAINAVRKRYLELGRRPPPSAADAARTVTGEEEDDDYDPIMGFDGAEQVMDRLDQMPPEGVGHEVAIGPFNLPQAPPLTEPEREQYSRVAVQRVFDTLGELDQEARTKGGKRQDGEKGFNRLATGSQDRDGWITLVMRLATRSTVDLSDEDGDIKREDDDRALAKKGQHFDLTTGIREALMRYFMDNWRQRIGVAIAWLNEEWYCDRLALKQRPSDDLTPTRTNDLPNYSRLSLRILDSITPYIDTNHKSLLIRFLSEIPELNPEILDRVRKVADDPERVPLATQALLYLIMLRPPVREMCVDVAEQLWRENEDAKPAAAKILAKWRPSVLEQGNGELKAEG